MVKPLGIRLTVDFAFKKTFGSPENVEALIGLLNAVLEPDLPIVSAEIVNPFSYREFADSKEIVLDVRCRDSTDRSINVEMQVAVVAGLTERLVYYASSLCVDQLSKGDDYTRVGRAISICLLRETLFVGGSQAHHRFQMIDRQSGRLLNNAIEVHTVELTKYNLDWQTIHHATPIEQWAFLLLHSHEYDGDALRRMLPGMGFGAAIGAIETISAKTEDKRMYDQREKAIRDYEWILASAKRAAEEKGWEAGLEKGKQVGLQAGRQEGLQEGRQEGRQKGLQEGRQEGVEIGLLTGKIQMLQELLGESVTNSNDLIAKGIAELSSLLGSLQQRLRDRSK